MGKKEVRQKNSSTGSLVGGREERRVERFRRENPLHRNLTYSRHTRPLSSLLLFLLYSSAHETTHSASSFPYPRRPLSSHCPSKG